MGHDLIVVADAVIARVLVLANGNEISEHGDLTPGMPDQISLWFNHERCRSKSGNRFDGLDGDGKHWAFRG